MSNQSMTDIAYGVLTKRKRGVPFSKLFEEVCTTLGYSDGDKPNKIAQFYSELRLDNRFASLKDNKWDLKSRHTFEETHIDTDSLIIDEDELDEETSLEDVESEKDNEEDDYE